MINTAGFRFSMIHTNFTSMSRRVVYIDDLGDFSTSSDAPDQSSEFQTDISDDLDDEDVEVLPNIKEFPDSSSSSEAIRDKFSDDYDDDDVIEVKPKQRSARISLKANSLGDKSLKNKKPKVKRDSSKKRLMSGVICTADKFIPKLEQDYTRNDRETDPCGRYCRYVPFEQVKDKILFPEKYLKSIERGIMTFLPNFDPGTSNHLEYFGFKQSLAETDLEQIRNMSLEELEAALAKDNEEISRMPDNNEINNVAVPGFSIDLEDSLAIKADVRTFDWKRLGRTVKFDVILMDPPWQLSVANATRGVCLNYEQMDQIQIAKMPIQEIQDNGYVFMWVIACQLANGMQMLREWGYTFVTYLNWVKTSKYGRYMPSHGYYMQHNKETILIGRKGNGYPEIRKDLFISLIISERRTRQSHKPPELYEHIERIFPGGNYIEIFARPHNLRPGWVSLGTELPE